MHTEVGTLLPGPHGKRVNTEINSKGPYVRGILLPMGFKPTSSHQATPPVPRDVNSNHYIKSPSTEGSMTRIWVSDSIDTLWAMDMHNSDYFSNRHYSQGVNLKIDVLGPPQSIHWKKCLHKSVTKCLTIKSWAMQLISAGAYRGFYLEVFYCPWVGC